MSSACDSLRIDRWLFYCRFYKTRVLATAAVTAGHVRINGKRTTPGSRVKCDDRVGLTRHRLPYLLQVTKIPLRRGSATDAQDCFVEDPDTIRQRERQLTTLKQDRLLMPRTPGRPDKHTRRKLRSRNRD